MSDTERVRLKRRRFGVILCVALIIIGVVTYDNWSTSRQESHHPPPTVSAPAGQVLAIQALGRLAVRERVSRESYSREQFGSGWATVEGCDMRNRILQRDLEEEVLDADSCTVLSGALKQDPYTGNTILFTRGPGTSTAIQIDHVVALSDAWQKGAQNLPPEKRQEFANDSLNLLATDGPTNMQKSDSDAAEWLPPEKTYRCRYIARQIAVKLKYALWITSSEHTAMNRTLQTCPNQILPVEGRP